MIYLMMMDSPEEKRVAIFVLIIMSSLFTVTISVRVYRIQFFEAVKTIWEDSFFYTYFTEENDVGFVSAYYEYQNSAFIMSADKLSDDEIIKIIEEIK